MKFAKVHFCEGVEYLGVFASKSIVGSEIEL